MQTFYPKISISSQHNLSSALTNVLQVLVFLIVSSCSNAFWDTFICMPCLMSEYEAIHVQITSDMIEMHNPNPNTKTFQSLPEITVSNGHFWKCLKFSVITTK